MAKKKDKKDKPARSGYDWMHYLFFAVIIILTLTINSDRKHFPAEAMIPSPEQVTNYCKSLGAEYGWLSSSCGADEVNCHYKLGGYVKNECTRWNVEGGQALGNFK